MKFDEFRPGQKLVYGPATLSEAEIVAFAREYDPQWFHADAARAQSGRWNGLIASGWQTCAIAMRLAVTGALQGSESFGSPGLDYLKWLAPVRPGDALMLQADVLDVRLSPGVSASVAALVGTRRQVTMNSSCGMCGRRSLESLTLHAAPLPIRWHVDAAALMGLPAGLRAAQPVFAETGGLHAAALVSRDGRIEASAEDVGRHNAVDKLIGRMLAANRLPLSDDLLVVSGRSSFEIVQKAWQAGIPLVAAVSAPSSLAVGLAREAGITLVGFLRDGRFNIYAHEARIGRAPARAATGAVLSNVSSGS